MTRTFAAIPVYIVTGDQAPLWAQQVHVSGIIDSLTPSPPVDWINVKRSGAVGDGVSDDTAAIQAAIDEAEARVATDGGATVYFPFGNYLISDTLTVEKDAVVLRAETSAGDTNTIGENGVGTLIAPTDDFPDGQYMIRIANDSLSRPLQGVRMLGLRVAKLQNQTLQNTVHGVYFKVYRGWMVDCFIEGMSGDCCVVQGHAGWNTYESKFLNNHFRWAGGRGLALISNTADMHFLECVVHGCTGVGLHVTGAASCHYNDCHFTGNLQNVHMDGGGSRSKFGLCKFEAADEHNVNLDATNGGITDLHFTGCNFNATVELDADNTYDNVIVQRASGGNSISGVMGDCTFQQISGTNNPRYHLNLSSAVAREWRVGNCKFDGNAQSGKINHHANAVRCTINNLGFNVGDPTTTGQWANQGEEGLIVRDTQTNALYIHAGGVWRSM